MQLDPSKELHGQIKAVWAGPTKEGAVTHLVNAHRHHARIKANEGHIFIYEFTPGSFQWHLFTRFMGPFGVHPTEMYVTIPKPQCKLGAPVPIDNRVIVHAHCMLPITYRARNSTRHNTA